MQTVSSTGDLGHHFELPGVRLVQPVSPIPGHARKATWASDRSEACALAKSAAMPPDEVTGELAQSLRSCSSEFEKPDGRYVFNNNENADDLHAAFVEIANQLKEIRKLY